MTKELKRPGYLRFQCVCGALVKIDSDDPAKEIHRMVNNDHQPTVAHECDPVRLGIAKLIGCTFLDGGEPN